MTTTPVHVVFEVDVLDADDPGYLEYKRAVAPLIESFGGRYLARVCPAAPPARGRGRGAGRAHRSDELTEGGRGQPTWSSHSCWWGASAPMEVSSPCPVCTTVSGGSARSFSMIEVTIVG